MMPVSSYIVILNLIANLPFLCRVTGKLYLETQMMAVIRNDPAL
jgi:hypothetical protein